MFRPASHEFVTLCRSQATLLSDVFGAAVSAVYVTNDVAQGGESKLVPIVVYPNDAASWLNPMPLSLPAGESQTSNPEGGSPALDAGSVEALSLTNAQFDFDAKAEGWGRSATSMSFYHPHRILLPLIHDDRVLGLLVVVRDILEWTAPEQTQLEEVADTIAMAWVLDQRSQGLMTLNYQRRALQGQQHQNLSNLLHQVRNPLTTLRTLGTLLMKRLQPSDANRQVAESILNQSEHLEELLLQFDDAIAPIDLGEAALESQTTSAVTTDPNVPPKALPPAAKSPEFGSKVGFELDLKLQPCWIADILQPLILSAVGIEEERQLSLLTKIPPELPPVKADAAALREVLSNLIDNALKYTPRGGEIRVVVQRTATTGQRDYEQRILVSDSGPGIPETDLERIFERHYRGIQAGTEISGTGLGLAIARDLVEQMQGQIRAYSPAIDQAQSLRGQPTTPGSTFVVTLPEC